MHKTSGLLVITFCLALFFFTCETALTGTTDENSGQKKYEPASQDKQKILDLVQEFQTAYDKHSPQKILALYSDDALIQTSTGRDDWVGIMLPKEEHAPHLSRQMEILERMGMKLDIFQPETLEIKENKGYWNGRYILYSTDSPRPYKEEGMISFEFKKIGNDWLIYKRTWQITDCNYPGFKK